LSVDLSQRHRATESTEKTCSEVEFFRTAGNEMGATRRPDTQEKVDAEYAEKNN